MIREKYFHFVVIVLHFCHVYRLLPIKIRTCTILQNKVYSFQHYFISNINITSLFFSLQILAEKLNSITFSPSLSFQVWPLQLQQPPPQFSHNIAS
mmetsp:Transcript_5105/g.7528  ORF Transcript_5105/g.7528 Transcript_5105/m.7528 type:complete len:96 (-) Transcript_5105:899-1186(-)